MTGQNFTLFDSMTKDIQDAGFENVTGQFMLQACSFIMSVLLTFQRKNI
jgi:hypothetical protein